MTGTGAAGGTPRVSFVIPAYNYGKYLPDCLERIFAQEGGYDFEVLIGDDFSTDDTPQILAAQTDPRVHTFRNERNLGHIETVERLVRRARGELIARIDPDDRYHTDFLARTVPVFDRHPRVGLVYGDATLIDEHGRVTQACTAPRHGGQPFVGNELVELLERNFVCAPTVISRREAWLETLPIPRHLSFHDWYFTVEIARRWDFYYVPAVLADYRIHSTNLHTRIAGDGREERSVTWMLEHVFSAPERDPELDRAKRRAKGRIFAAQALDAAEKYFWFGKYGEARRCYLEAARHDPKVLMTGERLRHVLATIIGRAPYEAIKKLAAPRRQAA